jgi:hypothetical protein
MSREDLKEIVVKVVERLQQEQDAPSTGCTFKDSCGVDTCDATSLYAIGEEG